MTKPRLLLDVDGVVVNILDPMLKVINEVLDKNFTYNDVTDYNIISALSIKDEEKQNILEEIGKRHIARDAKPFDDAIEKIKELDSFTDIYFVTSSMKNDDTWAYDRANWLQKYFGTKLGNKVVFTDYKFLVDGDIFIDDKPENISSWFDHNYSIKKTVILWSQPYNKNSSIMSNEFIYKFNDWKYLTTKIKVLY